jgi:hypothetical protein
MNSAARCNASLSELTAKEFDMLYLLASARLGYLNGPALRRVFHNPQPGWIKQKSGK